MGIKCFEFYNLLGILSSKNISNTQFAKDIGMSHSTLTMKLNGYYQFKLQEMLDIQDYIAKLTGTKYDLDYLFAKE